MTAWLARIALAGLLPWMVAAAEVREEISYDYYPVAVPAGDSLLAALNRATPIRQAGKVYHGNARWWVTWQFWWQAESRGCRIDRVEVQLTATILLPRLDSADQGQQARFDDYLAALKEHELGHLGFGQRAAREIGWGIRKLGSASSCDELEATANEVGQRVLSYYQQQDERYDRVTGHGRTQGAVLEPPYNSSPD